MDCPLQPIPSLSVCLALSPLLTILKFGFVRYNAHINVESVMSIAVNQLYLQSHNIHLQIVV